MKIPNTSTEKLSLCVLLFFVFLFSFIQYPLEWAAVFALFSILGIFFLLIKLIRFILINKGWMEKDDDNPF